MSTNSESGRSGNAGLNTIPDCGHFCKRQINYNFAMTKLEILLTSSSKQVKHDIYRREAILLLIDRNGQKTGHFFDKQLKLNF